MPKVQNDFYFRWAQDRIQATYNVNTTLDSLIEYVGADNSLGPLQFELPDSSSDTVVNGKTIYIIDQGSAATNNITVIPNTLDNTTIELESSYIIDRNFAIVAFELVDDQWVVKFDSSKSPKNLGAFYANENVTATIISGIGIFTDINAIGTAFPDNNNFTFATSPNTLTYIGVPDIVMNINVNLSLVRNSGSAHRLARAAVFIDNIEVVGVSSSITVSGNIKDFGFSGTVNLSTGSVVKVMLANQQSTDNIIVRDYNLILSEAI